MSEYVFENKTTHELCFPTGYQWERNSDIYFIITAKNLGSWLQHLINNLNQIYEETKDEHIHLVIFDYNSPDINLEDAVGRSRLPRDRFTIIQRPGKFIKTIACNEAVASVRNSQGIIFLLDLYLDISSNFINSIRKVRLKLLDWTLRSGFLESFTAINT